MTLGSLHIHQPQTPILIAVFLTLIIPVILTLTGRKSRRFLRLALSLIAAIALAAIALKPQWSTTRATSQAVLITPGYDLSEIRSFLSKRATQIPLFTTVIDPALPEETTFIQDPAWLKRNWPEINQAHVFGYGLPASKWEQYPTLQITPHLTTPPIALASIQVPQNITLGQTLKIQGRLTQDLSPNHNLTITDPGGTKHPIQVKNQSFTFSQTPPAPGPFQWKLTLQEGEDILIGQDIFVRVNPASRLKVLVLEDAPSFRTRHFKDWLTRSGAAWLIRSRISREQFRWESQEFEQFTQITPGVLAPFHLLVTDPRSLEALTPDERRHIQNEINQGGMGLYIRAEKPAKNLAPFFEPFKIKPMEIEEARTVRIAIPELPTTVTAIADPLEIILQSAQIPLLRDQSARITAAAQTSGLGHIATSLIRDTHLWALQGQIQTHDAYWSHLLTSIARPQSQIRITGPSFPTIQDSPQTLTITTDQTQPKLTLTTPTAQHLLPPRQDPWRSQQWTTQFIPNETGWHHIKNHYLYSYPKTAWPSLQATQKIKATQKAAQTQELSDPDSTETTKPIPQWPFALVALIALTLLWLERKQTAERV